MRGESTERGYAILKQPNGINELAQGVTKDVSRWSSCCAQDGQWCSWRGQAMPRVAQAFAGGTGGSRAPAVSDTVRDFCPEHFRDPYSPPIDYPQTS